MVDITHWLPPEINESPDAQEITRCENPEFDLLEQRTNRAVDSLFPLLADEQGIRVFENWLGLSSYLDISLDQRRLRVLSKLNERLPYTWIKLHKILGATIGWGNFELDRQGARVICKLHNPKDVRVVNEIFEELIPMNLYWILVDKPVENVDVTFKFFNAHRIKETIVTKPVLVNQFYDTDYISIGSVIRHKVITR